MSSVPGAKPQNRSGPCFAVCAAGSVLQDSQAALREIAATFARVRPEPPDFVTLHYGSARSPHDLARHARAAFGPAAVHGSSSCLGVMTGQGFVGGHGDALGAFAIWDPDGAYGSAMVALDTEPREAAARAIRKALERAGRPGEAPGLVWLSTSPGHEESVLDGIKDVIGRPALIVGASAADNDVAGDWSVFDPDGACGAGVVVSVLFPSVPFGCAFESGYAPTGLRGRITAADGRRLLRIDDRPAAEVYGEWTRGRISPPVSGSRRILSEATMTPLGRRQTEIGEIPLHLLAHPATAHSDGSLDLFARIHPGEEVCLMEGSRTSLVQRAGRIASASREKLGNAPAAGALVVYCGGCMLAIREHMNEVAASVAEGLGGAPFLGVFSFGEQGEMLDGDSAHGNLMISCTTFGSAVGPEQRAQP
jgi:hypothetical protein